MFALSINALVLITTFGFASDDFFCDFMDATNVSQALTSWSYVDCADLSTVCNVWGPEITCSADVVTGLVISSMDLHGTIPRSIGSLLSLTNLDLHANCLGGSIPYTITNLVNLEELSLNTNKLTGNIPPIVMPDLSILDLLENRLVGNIPSEIGMNTEMTVMYLHFNSLTGFIPTTIVSLTGLVKLYLPR